MVEQRKGLQPNLLNFITPLRPVSVPKLFNGKDNVACPHFLEPVDSRSSQGIFGCERYASTDYSCPVEADGFTLCPYDCGEDFRAYCVTENAIMSAVFDGCGGIGGRTYPELKGHTGAYVASRVSAAAAEDFFKRAVGGRGFEGSGVRFAEPLKAHILRYLQYYGKSVRSKSVLKGSLQKSFPSTMAMCITRLGDDQRTVFANILWAGDSRCYWLDSEGLHQLSVDDVQVKDAQENLHEDGSLTNMLNASEDFVIHEQPFAGLGKGVLLAATDGCFGYYPTPMHFERSLLHTLGTASNLVEWRNNLVKEFQKTSGDDSDLVLQIVNFGDFRELHESYRNRFDQLISQYIKPYREDPAREAELWARYSVGYNKYLAGATHG